MKQLVYLFAFLISTLSFGQPKERISLHLFDLPAGVTIEEFEKDLGVANAIYEKNGFGKARYKVYEVKSDDLAEQHRYMWLSTWQSDTEYENSHSDEITDFWDNYFTPKYKQMLDEHVYRKFFAVE